MNAVLEKAAPPARRRGGRKVVGGTEPVKRNKHGRAGVGDYEIALHLDINVSLFRKLAEEKVFSAPTDIDECRIEYIRYLREAAGGLTKINNELTARSMFTRTEKNRILKAKADKLEVEMARERGILVPHECIYDELVERFTKVKQRMLGLPTKAAPMIVGMKTVAMVEAKLREGMDEAARELGDVPDFIRSVKVRAGVAEGIEGTSTAAEADDQSVGRQRKTTKRRKQR